MWFIVMHLFFDTALGFQVSADSGHVCVQHNFSFCLQGIPDRFHLWMLIRRGGTNPERYAYWIDWVGPDSCQCEQHH